MSNLNDGWDDDEDLNLDGSEGGFGDNDDGWGDDDDLNFDDEVPASPAPNSEWRNGERTVPESPDNIAGPGNTNRPPPPPPRVNLAATSMDENGWGDDDDLDLDLGADEEEPVSTFRTVPESPDNAFGLAQNTVGFTAPIAPDTPEQEITFSNESNEMGWEDDEDLFGAGDELEGTATVDNTQTQADITRQMPPPDAKLQEIQQKLEDYVSALDRIVWSMNAVLEFEYSTPEKAKELVEYYQSRKQLAEYTRTKELSRMEYQVVLPFGHVETNKDEIGALYLQDESLLARCANQSLLADLLHQITGPDLIVRPAYLAVCVAHWCKFTIHIAGNLGGEDMVDCACRLHLSLPTAEGDRLNIAEITTQIVFKPREPMVEYRVLSLDVLLKDKSKLASTAAFLNMIEGHFDEFPGHEDVQLQNAPADKYRDAFLENSQKLLTQSTIGMKSALNQMESVVNLRQKLNIVKGGYKTISKLIPDTEQLLAVEEEARNLAQARQQEQQRSHVLHLRFHLEVQHLNLISNDGLRPRRNQLRDRTRQVGQLQS